MNTTNLGLFVGRYKGITIYARQGKYNFLFGWVPQTKQSLRAAKLAITKYLKEPA
jgi:hypothetical protein